MKVLKWAWRHKVITFQLLWWTTWCLIESTHLSGYDPLRATRLMGAMKLAFIGTVTIWIVSQIHARMVSKSKGGSVDE